MQVVLAHKKTPTTACRSKHPIRPKSVALFGVTNYLPERQPGDTDDTISDMIKIMSDENRRLKRNNSRIDQLMNQTFADRRQMIVKDVCSLKDLKAQFPCLFNQEQVRIINST